MLSLSPDWTLFEPPSTTFQFDIPNSHDELLALLDAEQRAILEHDLFNTHVETNIMSSVFGNSSESTITEALPSNVPTHQTILSTSMYSVSVVHTPAGASTIASNAVFPPSLYDGEASHALSRDLPLFSPHNIWDHSIISPTNIQSDIGNELEFPAQTYDGDELLVSSFPGPNSPTQHGHIRTLTVLSFDRSLQSYDSASDGSSDGFGAPDTYHSAIHPVSEGVYGDYQDEIYPSHNTHYLMGEPLASDYSSSGRHVHNDGGIADILLIGGARWTSTEGYSDSAHQMISNNQSTTENAPHVECQQLLHDSLRMDAPEQAQGPHIHYQQPVQPDLRYAAMDYGAQWEARSVSSRELSLVPEPVRLVFMPNVASMGGQQDSTVNNMVPSETALGKRRAAIEQELDDDAAHVKRMRYDSYDDGAASTSNTDHIDDAMWSQDNFEAFLASLAFDADESNNSPGTSVDSEASSSTSATTPENQGHLEHSIEDGVPIAMSQYELGVDRPDEQWLPESNSKVILFLACTRCYGRRIGCSEWDINGCRQCRESNQVCVERHGDPIVKAQLACLQCRKEKAKCVNQISITENRSVCE
ncbi:hypothetical protein OBBRIDRAFT_804971 [Obba rivulosa]|uniref:Uncharacterized protein n=1 Tax=Obba rivulosa TaxID=1052685 RepID=A0A8E2DJ80_9APHY|nr:hypothetical protein OBBRIDRAFT_804971 [Obba rivulosa]